MAEEVTPQDVSPTIDASRLQEQVVAFVRAFGLLRPDATPCGRPLPVSEAHALLELSRQEGLSQGELGQRLRLEKSSISRLVDQLQASGWVRRNRDMTDGRTVRLGLTEQGVRLSNEIAKARAQHFANIMERIPLEERNAVIQSFSILVEALEGDMTVPGPNGDRHE